MSNEEEKKKIVLTKGKKTGKNNGGKSKSSKTKKGKESKAKSSSMFSGEVEL